MSVGRLDEVGDRHGFVAFSFERCVYAQRGTGCSSRRGKRPPALAGDFLQETYGRFFSMGRDVFLFCEGRSLRLAADMHGDAHGGAGVGKRAGERLADQPCGVGAEFPSEARLEFLHGAQEQLFQAVNTFLEERGLLVKKGTLEDATVIETAKSRKNKKKKSRVRSFVEHPYNIIKNRFHVMKTRYIGLTKNTAYFLGLCMLSNVYIARRHLLPRGCHALTPGNPVPHVLPRRKLPPLARRKRAMEPLQKPRRGIFQRFPMTNTSEKRTNSFLRRSILTRKSPVLNGTTVSG